MTFTVLIFWNRNGLSNGNGFTIQKVDGSWLHHPISSPMIEKRLCLRGCILLPCPQNNYESAPRLSLISVGPLFKLDLHFQPVSWTRFSSTCQLIFAKEQWTETINWSEENNHSWCLVLFCWIFIVLSCSSLNLPEIKINTPTMRV